MNLILKPASTGLNCALLIRDNYIYAENKFKDPEFRYTAVWVDDTPIYSEDVSDIEKVCSYIKNNIVNNPHITNLANAYSTLSADQFEDIQL